MARVHLFEFEDQKWFPGFLRNYGTDFLQFLANKAKMFRPAVPLLKDLLKASNETKIVDLGSGGGGGWIWLSGQLQQEIPNLSITLTDLYPNADAFKYSASQSENINYVTYPVDAKNVPEKLKGVRTMFLSMHHFKPEDATHILQNAVDTHQPIAIFEGQERSAPSLLAMFFSPITVLLTTPLIRPFKPGRILFTYFIPIVPLFVWWDGIVSALRTYTPKEMDQLIGQVQNKDRFEWKTGKVKSGPGNILYLVGKPKD